MAGYYNGYSGYGNKNFAFNAIKELVQDGNSKLRHDLDDNSFRIWFDYSQKILELATKDNPNILLNYLRLSLSFTTSNLQAVQKLNMCLEYLLKIMEII